jgi:transposase
VSSEVFVGLEVVKAGLGVALRPSGERWTVANDERGVAELVARLRTVHPTVIVAEATGGFEREAVTALAAAGLPVIVASPHQIRDFARDTVRLPKTDRPDAGILALFGERTRPESQPVGDQEAQLVDALLTRRRQLLEMLVAEKNRLGLAPPPLHDGIREHIDWLGHQLDDVTSELTARLEPGADHGSKGPWLQRLLGVGPAIGPRSHGVNEGG